MCMYSFAAPEVVELPLNQTRPPEGNEIIVTRNIQSFEEIGERLGVAFGRISRFDTVDTGWHYDYAYYQLLLTKVGICEASFATLSSNIGLPTHDYIPALIPALEANKAIIEAGDGVAIMFRGGYFRRPALHQVRSKTPIRYSEVTGFNITPTSNI